ncbi:D-alanyl-D-alanine carboxypeptidase/D-alanyl-D-alanine-endopeptidase [Bdellovibrio sp. SKB1291214]|uniref:D-alanyl-D-alanine carboxypeptidase/D-alanyl-D-alanine endopeptidase n=1 Tax=Bdellovibrio sp. SKB1291214 TaxID=1732569 RepID=UPI0020CF9BF7|nr:D-alanyl-D-alanine carboxypeptidase/D-alanyl-D-alanine-endopeptidase [Bdellovibrio sp. SKB1291214]UYL09995.1 D-alanyl-D-alanine carboxypeptidase/D-alanyl-D-alanine-endopeptidase [Bdellovibrio sp. SKB1291214]
MRFFILTTAMLFSFSAKANLDAKFAQDEMQSLAKKSKVQLSDLSMYASVGEGENLKVLLDNNGTKLMIPASISKIATASAVLATFPPGHKFKTQIWITGDVDKKGVLKGNVYLKGGGDPSFVSENMWFLVNAFLRNDIKRVEGDIVVDDSLFDKMRYDISRQKERVDRAYDAPVGAMSFNWNSINIFVRPGAKSGDDARVYADPENEYIRLVAKTKTKAGGGEVFADRKEDPKFDGDLLHVGGSIGVNAKEVTIFKNITQPDLWSGYNLKAFLSQRGVSVTGAVKTGNTPSTASLAAEAESKAIEAIVADMNKFSNNYVAEMLTKNMGTLKKEKGVTLADGMVAIQEHMQALQIPKDQYHLESPSGLTRENKMSSYAMWKVLQHLRNDFRVQPEFLQSLPIAGIDGTLKKRMKGTNAERWVRAKTGYINNVVTLAGYAGLEDGRVITFSFIYNGATDEAAVRQYFDNLLKSLLK